MADVGHAPQEAQMSTGDDRNAGENPSQGRDAGAPGDASER
jgi:hypothetical protein